MSYTRADLDGYIAQKEPIIPFLTDMSARRNTNWKTVIAEYAEELRTADSIFAKGSTLSEATAPATGTEKINTTTGDAFYVSLVTGAEAVADDTLWLFNATTAVFEEVRRTDIDAIVGGGTGENVSAFYEINGKIVLYVKQGTVTVPADFHYNYWRSLSATFVDGTTVLDILNKDFTRLADRLAELMLIGIK